MSQSQKENDNKIINAFQENGVTVVQYSNGKEKKYYQSSSHQSNSQSSSTNYGTSHGTSYYSYSSTEPSKAFEAYDIEFWGASKYKLDDFIFQKGDLIINCSGTAWTPKAPIPPKEFTISKPSWLEIPQILMSQPKPHNNGELAEQVLLDWPDMKAPPKSVDFNFWSSLLTQIRERGIKRVICCCMAGQGRTGTALASILLATEMVDEPDLAIEYIRKNYNSKAIESKDQEEYIFDLIYDNEA